MAASVLTKKKIADTLMELARKKPVDKITVKDIAEGCYITRQTFYYHFHDILEVFEWTMEEKLSEMLEESLQMELPRDAVRGMISSSVENGAIIRRLMDSQYRGHIERSFVVSVRKYLNEMIKRNKLFQNVRYSDLEMAVRLQSYAMVGLLLEISYEKNPDVNDMTDQLCRLLEGTGLSIPTKPEE